MIYSEEKQIKKKLDAGVAFIFFQVLAVLASLIFLVCAKYIGGDFYSVIQKWYAENIGEKTSVEQVIDSAIIHNVKSDINSFCLPATGVVTSGYGYRYHPINGDYSMHRGIDIGGKMGEEVICAFDGVVAETGYGNSYGNYITVKHGDVLSTTYAHCSKIIATEGQTISKGDVVALMGDTGNTTGPHLHFEICIGGEPIDPQWIIKSYDL